MSEREGAVYLFFELYGGALGAGHLDLIVDCWGIPAFVLSDLGVQPVSESSEVESFFENAIAQYRAQGFASTRAEVERVDRLGRRVYSVDVRWSNLDKGRVERTSERWRYILKASTDEHLRIHVAIKKAESN